jgi:hypothetical protein
VCCSPGEQVPTEHERAAEDGITRGTARQPIMLLRKEGPIEAAWAIQDSNLGPLPYQRHLGLKRLMTVGHERDRLARSVGVSR